MIDYKAAKKIIIDANPLLKIRSALEFDGFFLFVLAPVYISDNEQYITGTKYPIVNKTNGKISEYDITSDLDAYDSAKQIV